MSNNIQGKVVVITGASSGLGEATARDLSAQGATVVLGARRADRIKSLADELTRRGGKALAVPTDVIHSEQVKKLVDGAVQAHGRIDVMINNAGSLAPLTVAGVAGVASDDAGAASGLINAAHQLGGSLGLAVPRRGVRGRRLRHA